MRELINWKDHVVEFPGRYREQDLGGGLVQHTPAPGQTKQEGTPQNATNFDAMDIAAFEAMLMANENTRMIMQTRWQMEGLKGLMVDTTLRSTQDYPFNNSEAAVQIPELRNTADYYVIPETLEADGEVGEYEVSEKLLNGFKLSYNGSAKTVKVRCHVIGGM